jgi:hypothetical protein
MVQEERVFMGLNSEMKTLNLNIQLEDCYHQQMQEKIQTVHSFSLHMPQHHGLTISMLSLEKLNQGMKSAS